MGAHALDCYHAQRTIFLKDQRCRFTNHVKSLEVDELKYMREAFPIAHEFELIKGKGYDYMDSFARYDESRRP